MDFLRTRQSGGLRGASKREQTRDELLKQAEAEREARKANRQRSKAAVLIQSAWRGYRGRQLAAHGALLAWHQRYAALAAAPAQQLPGAQVMDDLVPLLMAVVLPPGSSRTTRIISAGQGLVLLATSAAASAATATAGGAPATAGEATGAAATAATAGQHTARDKEASDASKTSDPAAAAKHSSSGSRAAAAPPGGPRPPCDVHAVLRGSLLLLMRSMTAPSPEHSYCMLACSADKATQCAWQRQAARLCQLCGLLLGSSCTPAPAGTTAGPADRLLQTAAARLLHLLLTPTTWKAVAADPQHAAAAEQAVAGVRQPLQQQPLSLFVTARKLLTQLQQQQQQLGPGAPGSTTSSSSTAQGGSQSPGTVSPALVSGVLSACVGLLQPHTTCSSKDGSSLPNVAPVCAGGAAQASSMAGSDAQQACLQSFVLEVLSAPSMAVQLSPADKVSLQSPAMLSPLLAAASTAAGSGALAGAAALHCYSNLLQLLQPLLLSSAARGAAAPSPRSTPSTASKADHLVADLVSRYCSSSMQLLSAAAAGKVSPSAAATAAPFDACCQQQLTSSLQAVCSRAALLCLLQRLEQAQQQVEQGQVQASCRSQPAGTPAYGQQPQQQVVHGSGEPMVLFAGWCLHVMEDLPKAVSLHATGSSNTAPQYSSSSSSAPQSSSSSSNTAPQGSSSSSSSAPQGSSSSSSAPQGTSSSSGISHTGSAASNPQQPTGAATGDPTPSDTNTSSTTTNALLNTLAFAPDLLPRLWRWLAVAVGVPLEAPLEASRGLDVAAVAGGVKGLAPDHALVMGVFCRAYSQLLLVLSDEDLHSRQVPFTTSASRAIATTLNSLVVRSFLPQHSSAAAQHGSQNRGQGTVVWLSAGTLVKGQAVLERCAPQVVRGLYDHDTRQSFCQPALWTAPFLNWQQQQQQQQQHKAPPYPSSAAAVAAPAPAEQPPQQQQQQLFPWQRLLRRHQATLQQLRQQQDSGPLPWAHPAGVEDTNNNNSSSNSSSRASSRRSTSTWSLGGGGPAAAPSTSSGGAGDAPPVLPFVAAVVQALLPGIGDEDQGGAAVEPASYGGVRPSALVALLKLAPQAVPFELRLDVFRQMLQAVKAAGRWDLPPAQGGPRPLEVTIHREQLLENAWRALSGRGAALKGRLMVTFIDRHGLREAGMDGGGLQKELLEQVVVTACQGDYGLFSCVEDSGALYPSPTAERLPQGLALLEFVGNMVGKALFEGILLDLNLAPFFTRGALQGRPLDLDDLATLDPVLYRSVLAVKGCQQVEALGLTFSTEQALFGQTVSYELLPGQGDAPVTPDNQLLYVSLLAHWHLSSALGPAAAAFRRGLAALIPLSWFNLFSAKELNQLVSGGVEGGIDVEDMKRYTEYEQGYRRDSHTIKLFWQVVEEFSPQQRAALLRFVTSTSRAPLGGFRHVTPPLTIQKVDCDAGPLALLGGKDVDRLPTAATCYNKLKLPNYRRAGTLREKLLYAIQSGAGFDLS